MVYLYYTMNYIYTFSHRCVRKSFWFVSLFLYTIELIFDKDVSLNLKLFVYIYMFMPDWALIVPSLIMNKVMFSCLVCVTFQSTGADIVCRKYFCHYFLLFQIVVNIFKPFDKQYSTCNGHSVFLYQVFTDFSESNYS